MSQSTQQQQSDYEPPLSVVSNRDHAQPSHEVAFSKRTRWGQAVTHSGRLRYMIEDYGGASGMKRREILDENYEGIWQ